MAAQSSSWNASSTSPEPTELTKHRWRDARMGAALKQLRPHVDAAGQKALSQLVARMRYLDRILANWDNHHARQAAAHLAAGRMEAADLSAWLICDDTARDALLAKITIGLDAGELAARHAANAELEREVLV